MSSNDPGKKAFYQLPARSQCSKWGGAGSKDAGVGSLSLITAKGLALELKNLANPNLNIAIPQRATQLSQ